MLSRILPALVLLGLLSYPGLFDHLHAWIFPEARRPQAGLTAVVGQNGILIDPDGAQAPTEAPRPGEQR